MDYSNLPPLNRDFYIQDLFSVMEQILGKVLITNINNQLTAGRIAEVEGYIGEIDKASHAYPNKLTKRTSVMFGSGGLSYVFTVHMYHQFNFTVGIPGIAHAILVRALEPLDGIEFMKVRRDQNSRKNKSLIELTSGPGKLCIAMNITKDLYGLDLTDNKKVWIADDGYKLQSKNIVKTKRVGIDYAEDYIDKPWRWYIKDSPFISKK